MIADASGAIGLAGIMGGQGHGDLAMRPPRCCSRPRISRPRRLPAARAGSGLFTDAAQRFERGVDPGLPALALERATALLLEIAGGEAGPVQITRRRAGRRAAEEWVGCAAAACARLLGASVPDARGAMRSCARSASASSRDRRLARAPAVASLRYAHRSGSDRGGRASARLRQHRRERTRDRPAGRRIRHRDARRQRAAAHGDGRSRLSRGRSPTASSIPRCSGSCFRDDTRVWRSPIRSRRTSARCGSRCGPA